jgi:hypothetical protein
MVSGANDDRDNHFQKGFREVRIIHGRGIDVQRKIVGRSWKNTPTFSNSTTSPTADRR